MVFVVLFHDCEDAFHFSIEFNHRLLKAPWPEELLRQPFARELQTKNGHVLYRGLTAMLVVDIGVADPIFDESQNCHLYPHSLFTHGKTILSKMLLGGFTILTNEALIKFRDSPSITNSSDNQVVWLGVFEMEVKNQACFHAFSLSFGTFSVHLLNPH